MPWARVAAVDKPVIHRECNLQGLTDWMQMMENGLRGFRRFGRNGFKINVRGDTDSTNHEVPQQLQKMRERR